MKPLDNWWKPISESSCLASKTSPEQVPHAEECVPNTHILIHFCLHIIVPCKPIGTFIMTVYNLSTLFDYISIQNG
uniref:Uncharacterized protein n=1 Tax=Romanomermis culicivorax TaxID=13658 RepID=A0A915I9T6_ROMCU